MYMKTEPRAWRCRIYIYDSELKTALKSRKTPLRSHGTGSKSCEKVTSTGREI